MMGNRLPYEEQEADVDSDPDDTDSDISEALPELVLRSQNIDDTIKTLYKLSFSIRRPGLKVAPEKAMLYRELIHGTSYEFGETFKPLDRLHVISLLNDLRKEAFTKSQDHKVVLPCSAFPDSSECPLIDRLAEAITRRRRKFKYWTRHKQKLARITSDEDQRTELAFVPQTQRDGLEEKRAIEKRDTTPHVPSSSRGPQTETVATKYVAAPIDQDDVVSIAPSASTARDLEGHEAVLPKPPDVDGESFECQYCFVLCPAKEATRSRWRYVSSELET